MELIHPNQAALDLLYFLYFHVSRDPEFDVMGHVEEHKPELFEFLTDLFHRITTPRDMDERADYWHMAIPRAVDDLT